MDNAGKTTPAAQNASPARLLRLERNGVDIVAWMEGADEPEPCRLAWLRPIHEPGGAFSVISLRGRHELAMFDSPQSLAEPSRTIALEALAEQYHMPVIHNVTAASTSRGSRTLTVETDCGTRTFALREPHLNIIWLTPDHASIKDVAGNRYDLPSLCALSPKARKLFKSIL